MRIEKLTRIKNKIVDKIVKYERAGAIPEEILSKFVRISYQLRQEQNPGRLNEADYIDGAKSVIKSVEVSK